MVDDRQAHAGGGLIEVGKAAPGFALHSGPGRILDSRDLRGQCVVLVFYPADWSDVCSDELAVFEAALHLFREQDATILGISVDGVWCHKAFSAARHLRFPLLSDFEPKGRVARLYGAYDHASGTCTRSLVVVDPAGMVVWSYLSPTAINPGVDGVLDVLGSLRATLTVPHDMPISEGA